MKTHKLCAKIISFNTKRKRFSDLTGDFPHKSICGNLYVMVVYEFDRNAILDDPENRQAGTIRDAFIKMHKILKSRGNNHKVYIVENEC